MHLFSVQTAVFLTPSSLTAILPTSCLTVYPQAMILIHSLPTQDAAGQIVLLDRKCTMTAAKYTTFQLMLYGA